MIAVMSPLSVFATWYNPTTWFGSGSSRGAPLVQLNVNAQSSPYSYNSYGSNGYSSYGSGSQCASGSLTLCSLIVRVVGYLNQILFLLIGLSVVTFAYYVFKFFIKPNEKHDEAGKYVMYSLIGFFVILSMWGLVNILQNTFGIGNTGYAQNSWTNVTNLFPR